MPQTRPRSTTAGCDRPVTWAPALQSFPRRHRMRRPVRPSHRPARPRSWNHRQSRPWSFTQLEACLNSLQAVSHQVASLSLPAVSHTRHAGANVSLNLTSTRQPHCVRLMWVASSVAVSRRAVMRTLRHDTRRGNTASATTALCRPGLEYLFPVLPFRARRRTCRRPRPLFRHQVLVCHHRKELA